MLKVFKNIIFLSTILPLKKKSVQALLKAAKFPEDQLVCVWMDTEELFV